MDAVLAAYEPFPALVVDRHWTFVAANGTLMSLVRHVAPRLLAPPVNVLRLSLAPDGLAPSILNFGEWRNYVLDRLRRDAAACGDAVLGKLYDELRALRGSTRSGRGPTDAGTRVAVPLVRRHPTTGERLSFLSTTTVFGTATDVFLAKLTLEEFLPADQTTREAMMRLA